MVFTGEAKKKFEKYFSAKIKQVNVWGMTQFDAYDLELFYQLPLSMQWGVIQDFANSESMEIDVTSDSYDIYSSKIEYGKLTGYVSYGNVNTRHEARQEAIKELNDYLNK